MRYALNIGVDLVEVRKVRKIFDQRKALQERIFTRAELQTCLCRRLPFVHLAARFVIKEALFKALESGLSGGMDWRDVEVQEEKSGKLALRLSGETAEVAHRRGVVGHRLSWSRTRDYAIGMVLLIVDPSERIQKSES